MTHKLDTDDYFIHHIQRLCAEARLNFFLIEPTWVELFDEHLKAGKVWHGVLLNMHSYHHTPDDRGRHASRARASRAPVRGGDSASLGSPPGPATAVRSAGRMEGAETGRSYTMWRADAVYRLTRES